MADGQGDSHSEGRAAQEAIDKKLQLEIEKLNLEIDALYQKRQPLQKIASSATAISAMVAVVTAAVGVIVSSWALWVQASTFNEARHHNEREEITSIIEKLTEAGVSPERRMGLVWALRQYWWGDNSEVLSNALGTVILYDEDPNVIQGAGLAFGRIIHGNPFWPKTKRVLFGSARDGDKGTILRFNLKLKDANKEPAKPFIDARFAALGDAVRLNWGDLRGINLAGAYLKGCKLYEADLEGADLREADLQGANLRGANLEGANLFGAHLQGARLKDANLNGANIAKAELDPPEEEKEEEKAGTRYSGKPAKMDLQEWRKEKNWSDEGE